MPKISANQVLALQQALFGNVNWDSCPADSATIQRIIDSCPKNGGKNFLQFLQNGGKCMTENVVANVASLTEASLPTLRSRLPAIKEFYQQLWGIDISANLAKIPEEYLDQDLILVFCPTGVDTRQAMNAVKKIHKTKYWEETPVENYSGFEASSKPTFLLIKNSVSPDLETLENGGMSPDMLRATEKTYLDTQRLYIVAEALFFVLNKKRLDKDTFTWLINSRLPLGRVAFSNWISDNRKVLLFWNYSDHRYSYSGARVAIYLDL
jgi:hypothetical protein